MAKKRRTGRFSLKEDRQLIQMAADSATVEEAAAILRSRNNVHCRNADRIRYRRVALAAAARMVMRWLARSHEK
jgi:hypothetical protein